MAKQYNLLMVEYKKVSGWANGPKKPDIALDTGGTDSTVTSAIESKLSADLPNLSKGDSVQIILVCDGET